MADLSLAILLTLVDQITAPARLAADAISGLTDTLDKTGESLTHMGEKMIVAGEIATQFSEKIVGALEGVVDPAMELDDALTRIHALGGAAPFGSWAEDSKKIMETVDSITTSLPLKENDLVAAVTKLRRAGLDTKEALDVLPAAARLAVNMHVDATDAATALAFAHMTLGDKTKSLTEDTAHMADVFTTLGNKYRIEPTNLLRTFTNLNDKVKDLNVSFDSTAALIGVIGKTNVGKTGPGAFIGPIMEGMLKIGKDSMEAWGATLRRNADGTLDLTKTLMGMQSALSGLPTDVIKERLDKTFGPKGGAVLMEMFKDGLGGLDTALKDVAGSAGAAAKAATMIGGSTTSQWIEFTSSIHSLAVAIGGALLPGLNKLLSFIKPIVSQFAEWAEFHPAIARMAGMIAGFAAIALGLAGIVLTLGGGILMFGGAFVTAMGSITGAIALIGGIAFGVPLLIAAIAGGAYLIYEYWGPIKAFFNSIGGAIVVALAAAVVGIALYATGLWAAVAAQLAFLAPWLLIVAAIAAVGLAVYEIYNHWAGIKAFFSNIGSSIWTAIKGWGSWAYDAGVNLIKELGRGIKDAALWPIHEAEALATKLAGYFVGHSPPPLGALHAIDNTRIPETIAASLQPAPVVHAMTDMAAISALAFDRELNLSRVGRLSEAVATIAEPFRATNLKHINTAIPAAELKSFTTEIPEASIGAGVNTRSGITITGLNFSPTINFSGGATAVTEEGRKQLVVDLLAEIERAGSEFGYQVAKIIERQMDDNERRKTGAGSRQWQ